MKNVAHNYLYNLAYQLVTLFVPFLTIPYITRVLEPEYLGIEAYSMSVISICVALATAGTTIYAIRAVADNRDNKIELSRVTYNLFALRAIVTLLVLIILLSSANLFNYKSFIHLQLFYFFANTLFDCTWYFIGHERFKEITIRNIVVKLIGFVLTILFVRSETDLYIYILIIGLTILIPNLYFTFVLFKEIGAPRLNYFSKKYTKKLLKALTPFFLLVFTIQVYMNIDRLILEHQGFIVELGIYNQILKSFIVFLGPLTAAGTVLLPYVSNLNSNGNKIDISNVIKLSTNVIIIIGNAMFWGLLVISDQFVALYFGPAFANYENFFKLSCLLILTGTLYNIIIQQVVFPQKLERIYLKGLIIATIMRVIIIFLLMDKYLMFSVLMAYIISEVFILFWCMVKSKNVINLVPIIFNLNNYKIFTSGLIMFIVLKFMGLNILVTVLVGLLLYPTILTILRENLTVNLFNRIKISRLN